MKSKKVILKFLSSTFLSLPVSLAVSFITFRNIDPYFMGVWSAMTIFETYANFLRLGVVNGMNRELPFAMGNGKHEEAMSYAKSTLGFSILNSSLLILIVPLVVTRFDLNATYLACLLVSLLRTTLNFYTTYLTGTFRTSDNFNRLSNIQFMGLVAKIILCPLIFLFGFYGFLVMELALTLLNVIQLHYFRPFKIKMELNVKVIYVLMKTGIPLFLTSYLVSFIDTFPKLFIIYNGNETMLGLYTPVLMILSTFSLLPNTLGTYFFPKFMYLYGKNHDAGEIWRKLVRIYLYAGVFILAISAFGYFLVDYLIEFFPRYASSLPYLKIAFITGPFVLAKFGNVINIVLKKINFMAYYVLLYAFFQSLFLFLNYYYFTKNILLAVVWSSVFTNITLFISSIIINCRVIAAHNKTQLNIIR